MNEISSRIPRKSAQKIAALLGTRQLSDDGYKFIINAIDPFSDEKVCAVGYPDALSTVTVTYVDTQTLEISAPSGIAANQTWDCNIVFNPITHGTDLPYLFNAQTYGSTIAGHTGFGPSAGPRGGSIGLQTFAIDTVLSGNPTFLGSGGPGVLNGVNVAAYGTGLARVVSAGFEVLNTTAEIYQQGSVVMYKIPNAVSHDEINISDPVFGQAPPAGYSGYLPLTKPFDVLNYPPSTTVAAKQLLQFGGATQTKAKDGCYVTCTQNSVLNPLKCATNKNIAWRPNVMTVDGYNAQGYPQNGSSIIVDRIWGSTLHSDAAQMVMGTCNRIIPFDQSGAYFFGLSPQTTLTLNTRVLLEVALDLSDANLISLGRISPSYDPLALELLSRVMHDAPAGVLYSENPFGEWFERMVGDLVEQIPIVGKTLRKGLGETATKLSRQIGLTASDRQGPNQNPNPGARNVQVPKKAVNNTYVERVPRPMIIREVPPVWATKLTKNLRPLRKVPTRK